ncbi:putative 39S ribosomal protein [Babesia sp. Xinjiang]|uniref:putative 39S ribosomal protein n=1 Tax=Babesia sp. Xinjiang TaxID=462227 RepID=UPI000A247CA7|nr:putative 39S ribosomal protein [Babesia sp. Xinjiang]XP_028871474.1 putative 39S ribosomal protein [Babesia sp. Xinjiang]ORM40897.1 putative 39S ribosomal protein [Babesia sp. Xinjiang]ORM41018.1 putative 39S ribosomal protein [Babesia sp. Xinjiang]
MQLYRQHIVSRLYLYPRLSNTVNNVKFSYLHGRALTSYRNPSHTATFSGGFGWNTSPATPYEGWVNQLSCYSWILNQKRGPKLAKPRDIIRFWKIRVGDEVVVISGKEKGKLGEVLACDKLRNQVKVKGCNMRKLIVDGQVLHIEKKMHYSNVQLIDPLLKCGTRVAIRFNRQNEPLRISKKSGYVIPWPEEKPEEDKEIVEGEKDTSPEVAVARTYDYEADLRSMQRLRQVMQKYNKDI